MARGADRHYARRLQPTYADLQRRLQEAQEERDVARAETKELAEKGYEASIWGWHKNRQETLEQLQTVKAERDAAIERAEAAEALILRIHKVCKHTLEGDRCSGWYKMVVFDIGQLTISAKAQEEGDDD